MSNPKIGFIGQGWIGKNYADDFEKRGYAAIRYALEEPYVKNGENIKECDIVFIAVPTPSTPEGFDASILKAAIKSVGQGKIAVIKSTLLPGTTEEIQKENPEIFVFHSPEFLSEATAALDAANPKRNIIGMPIENDEYREKAELVLSVLPKAPYELVCRSREAELIKYGGNNWFFFKVVYINLLYDLAAKNNARWEVIREAMAADPRIGPSHMTPVHKSGTLGGDAYHLNPEIDKSGERGAGGHCFIKDFAAFREIYEKEIGDALGVGLLKAMEKKNIDLLVSSGKDLGLLEGVYGKNVINRN
jgi:UDPglucose 6-dehydrogenase